MYVSPKIRTLKNHETYLAVPEGQASNAASVFQRALDNVVQAASQKRMFTTKDSEFTKKDLDRFKFNKTLKDFSTPEEHRNALEKHYTALKQKYDSLGSFYFRFRSDPLTMNGSPFDSSSSWVDYMNYSRLIDAALNLRQEIDRGYVDEETLKRAGVSIESYESVPVRLLCSISLEASETTIRFLKRGIKAAKEHGHVLKLNKKNPSEITLSIYSHPLGLDRLANVSQSSSRRPLTEAQKLNLFNRCRVSCLDLLNALNASMLHDLKIEYHLGKVELVSDSVASSLWCALLDVFQKGEIRECLVCGKSFLVPGKGSKKQTCSDSCRKKKSRLIRYQGYLEAGLDESEAAKKAEVSLDEARKFQRFLHD